MDSKARKKFLAERINKIQSSLREHQVGALLLTDPIHLRYATGVSVMPLWCAVNFTRYAIIPSQGEPIIFEYPEAMFRSEEDFKKVIKLDYWQYRFSQGHPRDKSQTWANNIVETLRELGLNKERVGVDSLDFYGWSSLQNKNLHLCDADQILQSARLIKSDTEISLMKDSAAITIKALERFRNSIKPGVTENQLLADFWHEMLADGGEWCYTRLIASGQRTNPWFHEAGDHKVNPGDLVAIDTDLIGPEGYACDVSRTYLCGDQPTPRQLDLYKKARDFIDACAELLRPGISYEELTAQIPSLPTEFMAQRYPVWLHGIGTDDEPPFLGIPGPDGVEIPDGELQKNMVVCIEAYLGEVGDSQGVKLENQYQITEDGYLDMCPAPHDLYLNKST